MTKEDILAIEGVTIVAENEEAEAMLIAGLPEPMYRSDPRTSNSDLGLFETSPRYYKSVKDGRLQGVTSSGFELGTLVDDLVTRPEIVDDKYIRTHPDLERPGSAQASGFCRDLLSGVGTLDAMKNNYVQGNKSDEKFNAESVANMEKYREYLKVEKLRAEGKIIISHQIYEEALLMVEGLKENKDVRKLLFDRPKGVHVLFQCVLLFTIWGLKMRSLLDFIYIDEKNKLITLVDLKTSSKPLSSFKYWFKKYHYYRQFFTYAKGLSLIFPGYKIRPYVCVATNGYGNESRVWLIPAKWIQKGMEEAQPLIEDIQWHFENEKWEFPRSYYNENAEIEELEYVE